MKKTFDAKTVDHLNEMSSYKLKRKHHEEDVSY